MLSTKNISVHPSSAVNEDILEKVILGNDLAGLKPAEKVLYINGVCKTLGLNPTTNPIKLMKFNGKEIPYFSKDATEQLRSIKKISLKITDTKVIDDVYIVTVEANTPEGRNDSATGVVNITGLKGDAKANAFLKCETKAKRRVTLSICGLGFLDESELDTMQGHVKVPLNDAVVEKVEVKAIEFNADEHLLNISQAHNLQDLELVFKDAYKQSIAAKNQAALKQIIEAKDNRKAELQTKDNQEWIEEYNQDTGEVK